MNTCINEDLVHILLNTQIGTLFAIFVFVNNVFWIIRSHCVRSKLVSTYNRSIAELKKQKCNCETTCKITNASHYMDDLEIAETRLGVLIPKYDNVVNILLSSVAGATLTNDQLDTITKLKSLPRPIGNILENADLLGQKEIKESLGCNYCLNFYKNCVPIGGTICIDYESEDDEKDKS